MNPKDLNLYKRLFFNIAFLNLIQDGPFRGCSWIGESQKGPLPKICHTYIATMKFGTVIPCPKKIKKIYESRDTTPEFC